MNNKKIHHLDSSPPLSFLIIKDRDNNNSTDSNNNKPIIQNAGRFKKVQITIINDENSSSGGNSNNHVNSSGISGSVINVDGGSSDGNSNYIDNTANNNNNNNSNDNNSSSGDNILKEEENDKLCKICNKQFSLYTCPRCNINYCSLVCFKSHRCSTEFFEQQLHDNLKNIDKVSPKDSLAFLKRMKEIYDVEDSKFAQLLSEYNLPKDVSLNQLDQYAELNQEYSGSDGDGDSDSDGDERVSRLDGLNLDEMSEEELLALLTKEEIQEFINSIKDGTISNLIEGWVPWWTIDIDTIGRDRRSNKIKELNQDTQLVEDDQDKEESEIKALLSRIPNVIEDIQPFAKLTNNRPASSVLYFHLIDILYCYCFLMRTFNGEWASQDSIGGDSSDNSDTLLEGCKLVLDLSTVLKPVPSNKQDFKLYQSHLSSLSSVENVLNGLLTSSHSSNMENNKNKGNVHFSLFLLEDVISILNHHSFILSSISHLFNSFKSSIGILKSNYKTKLTDIQQHQNQQQEIEIKNEYQLLSSCFENISKKLKYFLSWVNQEHQDSFRLLSSQVLKYFENEKSILLNTLSNSNNNK